MQNKWNGFCLFKENCRWLGQCRGLGNYMSLERMLKCFLSPNLLLFIYVTIAGWEMGKTHISMAALWCCCAWLWAPLLLLLGYKVFGFFFEEGGCGMVGVVCVGFFVCVFRFSSQRSGTHNWLLWCSFVCTKENVDLSFGRVEGCSSLPWMLQNGSWEHTDCFPALFNNVSLS